jgi:dTDP-4-amino-4,6-dideoxygalactose transaminase
LNKGYRFPRFRACMSLNVRIGISMSPRPSASIRRSQPESQPFDSVPMLDLSRQYGAIRDKILSAIERVCASQRFILGAEVEALENELAAFTGAAAAVACASGTDALWLALMAVGVQPGDAVITTPFSFFASASAIARAGARPVFVDINPYTFNIDPAKVRDKLRGEFHFAAILPVHLYGQCADLDSLQQIAQEFGIPLVEDAAQAIGATWQNRGAGSIGQAAAFSFYPSKNLSAYGDAGLVTAGDKETAERVRRLRNHGSPKRYYHDELGANSRMDDIQAAVLRVKLPYLPQWNAQRQLRAATYDQLFTDAGLLSPAGSAPVAIPYRDRNARHIFHQYVVRASRRDDLRAFLAERKIGSEIYYPVPLHLQVCFNYLGYSAGDLPCAEHAAQEVLALPMFPELTESEQRWVVESIAEFYS